ETMPIGTAVPCVIHGSDRAGGAIEVAQRNAKRAGVDIDLQALTARDVKAPAPTGLLVANPPYDRRVKGQSAAWDALRGMLRGEFAGWRAAILCPAPHLAERLGRPIAQSHRLTNGGLPLNLLILDPHKAGA
ncbi:MAG: 23S rRNA G2445 N2-methylase RlmL, partial [Bradymonadia bacterium]